MKRWNERLFLYINGELYRKLATNKADDTYTAQNCASRKIQTFSYRVVRDTHEKAYNVREVGTMLGRKPETIRRVIKAGHVSPQKQSLNHSKVKQATALGGKIVATNAGRCEYYFSPSDLYEIRDYFAHGTKYARSGKLAVPSRHELKSMIEQNVVLYVQAKDGSFVPTWQAVNF